MIRSFQLRDVGLLRRLGQQIIPLNAEIALTRNPHPLRTALAQLVFGGEFSTFVWRPPDGKAAGFAQLSLHEEATNAHILYLGSAEDGDHSQPINATIWLSMLDQLLVEAGRRGIHNVIAEVREDGPELPILRQAGFAVFTRQDIWMLKGAPKPVAPAAQLPALHAPRSPDDWEIQLLYTHIVPHMIQLVEPYPPDGEFCWVVREQQEVGAYINLTPGPEAHWLQLWVHPNAKVDAAHVVAGALRENRPGRNQPVFCCIRRYQSWLQTALKRNGFEYWGSQAVMVKHTVSHVKKPVLSLEALLEAETQTTTAHTSPIISQSHKERRDKSLEQPPRAPLLQ